MNAIQWKALKKAAGYRVDETLPQHFEVVSTTEAGGTVSPIVWGEENARLMAAAPELLESLREAEQALRWAAQEAAGRVKAEVVGGWLHHASRAAESIAKAEGRE